MKNFIIKALDDAMSKFNRIAPKTKKVTKSVDIIDVNPLDIPTFMKDNNIPDNAYFNGVDNGYDDWTVGEINLSWDIEVPTTDDDKFKFVKKKFNTDAHKFVFDELTSNGYKRLGFAQVY